MHVRCLNPCFNGRYSQSAAIDYHLLVLVAVLILVLMEDTLRDSAQPLLTSTTKCLNPCFNGRYSQRHWKGKRPQNGLVLILVLMEDTLRGRNKVSSQRSGEVLILVLMEDTLREG